MKLTKIALGCAMAVGTVTAQASDVLMFPYVVSGGAVTTLVTVINTDIDGVTSDTRYYNFNGTAAGNYSATEKFLHWRYHIKTANNAASQCFENNGYFPTSPLDMVTYDVSGTRGEGGVMFNDPSFNNNWKAVGAQNQLASITLAGERALLFVHNAGFDVAVNPLGAGRLSGEALIVEFDTGAAWGYRAILNPSSGLASPTIAGSFSTAADFNFSPGSVANVGPVNAAVSLLPMNEVTTRFFITPVNDPLNPQVVGIQPVLTLSMLDADGLDPTVPPFPGINASFGGLRTVVDLAPIAGSIRVLDRDEGGLSGGVTPQTVTCVWPVDASNLITAPNILNYTNPQGGFVNVQTRLPGVPTAGEFASGIRTTPNAVAIKLEFRPAGSGGQLPAGLGAFNNAFRIN